MSKMEYLYAWKTFMCSTALKSFNPKITDGFIYKNLIEHKYENAYMEVIKLFWGTKYGHDL